MINPNALPPAARLQLSQTASVSDSGLVLRISGTGWESPDFGDIDWSQPQVLAPIGPVPGDLAQVQGLFDFELTSDFDSQQVSWTISTRTALDGSSGAESSQVTVSLLDKGWQVLRAIDGTAIPMIAYSKRRVAASGTGTPPVSAQPLQQTTLAGISILVTDYSFDTMTEQWSISGEEA